MGVSEEAGRRQSCGCVAIFVDEWTKEKVVAVIKSAVLWAQPAKLQMEAMGGSDSG